MPGAVCVLAPIDVLSRRAALWPARLPRLHVGRGTFGGFTTSVDAWLVVVTGHAGTLTVLRLAAAWACIDACMHGIVEVLVGACKVGRGIKVVG